MRPSPLAERIVALLLPPPCREHVLGDLAERYRSPSFYVFDVASTVPCVIFSQARRAIDPLRNVSEAGLLYLTTAAMAYLWGGADYLLEPGMTARLAAPALAAFAGLLVARVYERLPYWPGLLLALAAGWWVNLPILAPPLGAWVGYAALDVLSKYFSSGGPPRHVTR